MAVTYKVLGQSAPAATTNTDLYTVPALTQAVASTLAICNQGLTTTVRVAVRVAGAAITQSQYIVYDNTVNSNDTMFLTLGIALGAGDIVTVYAGTATTSFSLYGSEIA
jgi:hypothetical protein